ncbi:hypothetical protein Q7P37_003250 [Cladosporium fusiforme]
MSSELKERVANEVALLQAMYPDQVSWNADSQEMTFKGTNSSMVLRLEDDYLTTGRPVVLAASVGKRDISGEVKKQLLQEYAAGEEVLDATVTIFDSLVADHELHALSEGLEQPAATDEPEGGRATIVVWLHHLLNSNKRKMALSPNAALSGVTKPGYPGVLVYSGPANAVREHVAELKELNWAAFQVRLDVDEAWNFAHGKGVKEVEGMGDLVGEIEEAKKEDFMLAVKIK